MSTWQVPHIFGVQGGFSGLSEDENWIELTYDLVQEHHAMLPWRIHQISGVPVRCMHMSKFGAELQCS